MSLRRLILLPFILSVGTVAADAQSYTPAGSIALGAPDRWDYVVADSPSGRVYVAHGDRVEVIDGHAGTLIGTVTGIPGGTHGIAISAATGQGFTDDGKNGQAVAFDLKSLKVTHQIPAREDADAIAIDQPSGHIFVIDGDSAVITVIDPKANKAIATIDGGEKLEYAVSDDHGALYVAGEAKGDLIKISTKTNTILARWPAADCKSPHGLAIDRRNNRLLLGCVNNEMIVLDAATGRVIEKLAIGKGSDAIAFDPVRKRVFSSNGGDGTISVYQEDAGKYHALPTIQTKISARTMSVDPKTGRLFVAAADTDPSATAGGKPKVRPGSLQLLMFDPKTE